MSPPPKYCTGGGGVTIVTPPKVLHRGGVTIVTPPQSIAQGGGVTIVIAQGGG